MIDPLNVADVNDVPKLPVGKRPPIARRSHPNAYNVNQTSGDVHEVVGMDNVVEFNENPATGVVSITPVNNNDCLQVSFCGHTVISNLMLGLTNSRKLFCSKS